MAIETHRPSEWAEIMADQRIPLLEAQLMAARLIAEHGKHVVIEVLTPTQPKNTTCMLDWLYVTDGFLHDVGDGYTKHADDPCWFIYGVRGGS